MSIAEIRKFHCGFEISTPSVGATPGAMTIAQRLGFSGLDNVTIKEGVYSANNDYMYLVNGITPDKSPNFLYIQCGGIVNVTVVANGVNIWNSVPINKLGLLFMPFDTLNKIDTIYFEGRLSVGHSPMPQAMPVEYYFMCGQAVMQ